MIATYGLEARYLPGFPPLDSYEATLGLWQNSERVSRRQAWWTLQAVQEGQTPFISQPWFVAMAETSEEGRFRHEMHESQVNFAIQSARSQCPVD